MPFLALPRPLLLPLLSLLVEHNRQSVSYTHLDVYKRQSEDNSIQIANEYIEKDPRFILLKQKNSGQSTARNRALIWAKGTYVYFFDSDDYIKPQTIQILVNESLHNNLDLVLFAGGESFYEDKNLERKFPQYKEYYKKKCEYNDVYNGCDLYPLMVKNRDYNVSPCLQFIKRD